MCSTEGLPTMEKGCTMKSMKAMKAMKAILFVHFISLCVITSSTAQGGGGSFKNRKPIGEIACCESRMAAQTH